MNMKKVMAAAAAVCMLCTAVAATNPNASAFRTIIASAADEQLKSGDFTYELVNDTVTITACAVNEGVVEIPSEIDGKPVTAIGAAAFYGSKISGVVFPDTLTEIGGGAFWHSPSLTSVKIPDGVTFVGNHAFADCQSLTEIEIPESVTSFGAAPFDLTPWTDARREENPFVIVNGIVIDAAKAVDDILAKRKAEEEALKKDLEDKNVVLIYNKEGEEEEPFEIVFPDGITSIGETVFVDLQRSINVTKIVIPDGVTQICANAFSLCHDCTDIQLPNTLEDVGDSAFAKTKWIADQPKTDGMFIVNGLLLDGKSAVGNIEIPDGVRAICGNAFTGNKELISVRFPETLTVIHQSAFKRCTALEAVYFPESLKEIRKEAFTECPLKSLVIPEGVEEIGYRAFITCNALPSVAIRSDNVRIDEQAFGYKNTFTQTGQYMHIYILSVRNDFILECREGSTAEAYAAANEMVCRYGIAGDANDDFVVDISDVILLSRYAAEDATAPELSEKAPQICDMNADGVLNAADVNAILQIIAHLDEEPETVA